MSEQLILNVNLKDDATFENFFLQKGSENAVAVEVLQKQLLSQKTLLSIFGVDKVVAYRTYCRRVVTIR